MKTCIFALLSLFCALPAAADECGEVAELALANMTSPSCDLSSAQCRKYYRDKFRRECMEAAYGKKDTPAPGRKDSELNEKIQAYNAEAAGHARDGRPDKAVESFSKALKLAPDNAELRYNRGSMYASLGETDKAITDLSLAIKANPAVAGGNAYVIRGGELFKKKNYKLAIKDYTELLKLTPGDPKAYASRASCHAAAGDHAAAVADYTRAIKLDASNPKFFIGRLQSYTKLGRTAEAQADERTAMKLLGR